MPLRVWENRSPDLCLSKVLNWCLREHQVDTLLVAHRPPPTGLRNEHDRGCFPGIDSAVRTVFGDRIIKSFWASGWPGTQLFANGRVYVIRFDETVAKRMASLEDRLFAWDGSAERRLPEDLCVFRDGSRLPVLVSVTHEKDAWIISDKKSQPPGFTDSSFKPEEYVWDGPYFCRRMLKKSR
jgi:hypothetical protein